MSCINPQRNFSECVPASFAINEEIPRSKDINKPDDSFSSETKALIICAVALAAIGIVGLTVFLSCMIAFPLFPVGLVAFEITLLGVAIILGGAFAFGAYMQHKADLRERAASQLVA